MTGLRQVTADALARALVDADTIVRYRTKVLDRGPDKCWPWLGALSGRGHGRFWLGRGLDRPDVCVIAHRYGYGLAHGLDALLAADMVAHRCDEPWCQNPAHGRPSNALHNGAEYARRRAVLGGALRDRRGARARAVAVRQAAVAGGDLDTTLEAALAAGLPNIDRVQLELVDRNGVVVPSRP